MIRKRWTLKDEIRLSGLYPDHTAAECAEILECSMGQVYSAAKKLGLNKSEAFKASTKSGRLNGVIGATTRFKFGHEVWNKGLKGLTIGGVETQFKPGTNPYNTLSIGSVRVTTEGYHQRKISNTGNNKIDWLNLHWELWIKHNGPLPKKHIIRFANGDKSDIRIENLLCVSRAENARLTVNNQPPEIKKINQLRSLLHREINKQRKSA